MEWNTLNREDQLEDLVKLSEEYRVVIFKHSTSCGISRMILKQVESIIGSQNPEQVQYFFLDLLRYRSVSNAIASKFGVIHQSPQMIILDKGEVVYADSHSSINIDYLVSKNRA